MRDSAYHGAAAQRIRREARAVNDSTHRIQFLILFISILIARYITRILAELIDVVVVRTGGQSLFQALELHSSHHEIHSVFRISTTDGHVYTLAQLAL